jgi:outer membrane lipoprotein-sorting protein
MGCLTEHQIARFGLGQTADAKSAMHLKECDSCQVRLKAIQEMARQLTVAHAKLDQGHEQARERLLSLLPAASRMPESAGPLTKIKHTMGGFTMRQRISIALGGVGIAAVLTFLMLWEGIAAKPVSAMEQMAENIHKAKSFQATTHSVIEGITEPDNKKNISEITGKVYWRAPDSYRVEQKGGRNASGIDDSISIFFKGKPGIEIDLTKKEYRRQPARQGPPNPFMMVDKLGAFRGQAEQDLGAKIIGGAKVQGFIIDNKIIDPDAPAGKFEIWTDTQSNLPIQIIIKMKMREGIECKIWMDNIQWNVELESNLFAVTPPEGCTETLIPKEFSTEEKVQHIISALRKYAELSGGHYPQANRIYGDQIMFEVRKMMGKEVYPTPEQRKDKDYMKEYMKEYFKKQEVSFGFGDMTRLQSYNPNAAYYGKSVGPKDKDKVLFRWKLDDGNYAIIYGDLHHETVTAEKLHALEGK